MPNRINHTLALAQGWLAHWLYRLSSRLGRVACGLQHTPFAPRRFVCAHCGRQGWALRRRDVVDFAPGDCIARARPVCKACYDDVPF